ncbi:hypothetical protein O0I10_010087 [Lichtheimia ornata]|uniref:Uncharacterized protein n=1 Tax=Lichtheimia ornata TaxID=688661 RepID=A0AAD7UVX8_9FUNG|nr:uncharacterized protein O0I10_010087 [Lichtheimia ornata]KAJ8654265.1 hypothetical protein O0I10_010087 [Lichtheimia ornata]
MVLHLPITNDTTDNHSSNTAHASFTNTKKKTSRKVRFAEDTSSNQRTEQWLQELCTIESAIEDDLLQCDFDELNEKTEEAHAMMEMILSTQKKICDDNMRQAAMWQEKLDALENSKPSIATQSILESLAAMATRINNNNVSCDSHYSFTLNPSSVETPSFMQEQQHPTIMHRRTNNAESEMSTMADISNKTNMECIMIGVSDNGGNTINQTSISERILHPCRSQSFDKLDVILQHPPQKAATD